MEEEARLEEGYASVEDPLYLEEEAGRLRTFEESLQVIEGHVSKGLLLDIGCYTGAFAKIAQERGWGVYGIEPSSWAWELATKGRGLQVARGTLLTVGARFPGGTFDVVTMWDVIEHLADPLANLREVNRLLKDGGMVFLSTIDIECLTARLLGERYPFIMWMHTYYFSRRTLRALLEKVGFEGIGIIPSKKYLSVRYLLNRIEDGHPRLHRVGSLIASWLGCQEAFLKVPSFIGEIFAYGRKA